MEMIPIKQCGQMSASFLAIHIFFNEKRLQGHIVKHMARIPENEAWNARFGLQQGISIRKALKEILKSVDCKFDISCFDNTARGGSAPCIYCDSERYKECTKKCKKSLLHDNYTDAVIGCLKDSFEEPCHIHYQTNDEQYCIGCINPSNHPLIAVLYVRQVDQDTKNIYNNVATCYIPTGPPKDNSNGRQFVVHKNEDAILSFLGSKYLRIAKKKTIEYCMPSSWEINKNMKNEEVFNTASDWD